MFRYPLTATGLKWIWLAILITAAFVWLFNSYKLGKFRRKKQTDFSNPIRTGNNHRFVLYWCLGVVIFYYLWHH